MAAAEHPYARLAEELRGTSVSQIRYVESTASTNDDAAALLGDPAALGTTIVAEHQTGGIGRKGRPWLAAPGTSLLMTSILPRSMPAANLWIVPFGVAIAVRRALANCGIRADLHWPNDMLVGGKKLAGILCISRVVGDRACVAAGVGINVHRKAGASDGIDPPPAFCDDVVPTIERAALLRQILLNYDVWHSALDMPPRIARVWERQAGIPGARYRILKDDANDAIDVTALALANGGGLLVQGDNGRKETIDLADARALR
ncbi:MAG TPA: biotin--[acetyl-CoA-carboxylase] ligase [Candidatus Baltobacteraceae bacterium]|nr:biotin--[acetyl-CoA-carboxylase] ligase [Candidatus Baltobacteraceae bacterium]